jgi:pyruvate kinase
MRRNTGAITCTLRLTYACRPPIILSTELLESMTTNPKPSRAEATDIANIVHEGAHAVMLTAETAIGLYPVQVRAYDRVFLLLVRDATC